MAIRYYDDALAYKISRWIPKESNLRILKPDESKRLFELTANDRKDQPFKLPLVALSRDSDVAISSNIKQLRSFDGIRLSVSTERAKLLNVIPIKLNYRLDIYTKTVDEADEYLRTFLFKLINNPVILIEVPYNNSYFRHKANIRVAESVSDTSTISERLFSGQFQRWTINLEIQDAFLFNLPYKDNWKLINIDNDVVITYVRENGEYHIINEEDENDTDSPTTTKPHSDSDDQTSNETNQNQKPTSTINNSFLYAGLELVSSLSDDINPNFIEPLDGLDK